MSDLIRLYDDWKDCTRCPLGRPAKNHVLWEQLTLFQGKISSYPNSLEVNHEGRDDLVIVGEGPGVAEDVIGRPFVGPSGRLLRDCLLAAVSDTDKWRVTLTNLVACRPFGKSPAAGENRPPTAEETAACAPRLAGVIAAMQPYAVVAAGSVPREYLLGIVPDFGEECMMFHIRHPAWLIRQSEQELARSVYVEHLKKIFEEVKLARGT